MNKLFVVIILLIVIFTISCSNKNPTNEELFNELVKTINNIETYSADVNISIESNKGKEKYSAKHIFSKPKKYRIKYLDEKQEIYFDGKSLYLIYPNIDKTKIVLERKEIDQYSTLFIGYFLEIIQTSEKIEMKSDKDFLIIDLELPGNSTKRRNQRIWFSKENFKPHKMIITDTKGMENVEVKYDNLNYNVKLTEDMLFE
ncbi:LolA family protein [Senegalia massiliensis]|uniref:LolA family protein n=1 Tax=Senegalia massiliensis TaxID=1720316 RepID=UPI0010315AFC|nr:outer-membrane lipoprotein carrier protein LolA [Senegalia massiliensis]